MHSISFWIHQRFAGLFVHDLNYLDLATPAVTVPTQHPGKSPQIYSIRQKKSVVNLEFRHICATSAKFICSSIINYRIQETTSFVILGVGDPSIGSGDRSLSRDSGFMNPCITLSYVEQAKNIQNYVLKCEYLTF